MINVEVKKRLPALGMLPDQGFHHSNMGAVIIEAGDQVEGFTSGIDKGIFTALCDFFDGFQTID